MNALQLVTAPFVQAVVTLERRGLFVDWMIVFFFCFFWIQSTRNGLSALKEKQITPLRIHVLYVCMCVLLQESERERVCVCV